MKITVGLELNQGHSQCEDAAPDVFFVSDDGFSHLHTDEVKDTELVRKVQYAASRCPTNAIVLTAS